jgi:hypothetical protein
MGTLIRANSDARELVSEILEEATWWKGTWRTYARNSGKLI